MTSQPNANEINLSPAMQACAENCLHCHAVCFNSAMTHCLAMGGKHVEQAHFRLMMNCADVCTTCANFMLADSPMHAAVCKLCADVCRACADSCEAVGDMDACVAACRRCAKSCAAMAAI